MSDDATQPSDPWWGAIMYMSPGILAGIVLYALIAVVNLIVVTQWSAKRRIRAHTRLMIFCLVAAAFMVFLALKGGGGNWATHLAVSGFLLAGCALSLTARTNDKEAYAGDAAEPSRSSASDAGAWDGTSR